MKTSKQCMKELRQRRKKEGYVRHEFWLLPEWVAKIKKFIESLK